MRNSLLNRNKCRYHTQNRTHAGFTLPEVLLVVAILVVLFAVSITGVTAMQRNLRQKALDSKAEMIYMAAQNRLTELCASGRENLISPKRSDVTELGITPLDASDDRMNEGLYYVSSANAGTGDAVSAASALLPASRVESEIRDKYWVIEFDYASGRVYAVFYSETPMEYTPTGYDALRLLKNRRDDGAKVGYYGGDRVVTINTDALRPAIQIYNEEKLRAVLTCESPDGKALTFYVRITDSFGNYAEQTISETQMYRIGRARAYDLVLDDLTSGAGRRFKDQYPNLAAGSDLTIRFRAVSESNAIDQATVNASANSLFASVDGETAVITYARHLQNLDKASGVNDLAESTDQNLRITAAVQQANLHMEKDYDDADSWYEFYGENAYQPIRNEVLKTYCGSYTLSEGADAVRTIIYGLKTKSGMFETFWGNLLKDISLSGPEITGGEAAGALAGTVEIAGEATVSGCRVYLDKATGDLDRNPDTIWISGTKYVGGLIGHAKSKITVENSFAATVAGKRDTECTGGLIGKASGLTCSIENAYADCYLSGASVGGLLGGSNMTTALRLNNTYAVGYIYASKEVAGLAPVHAEKIDHTYAVLAYENANDAACYATVKSCNIAQNLYFIPSGNTQNAPGTALAYRALSNRDESVNLFGDAFTAVTGGDYTAAYNLLNQGLQDYSFPRLSGLPHYGDWKADFEDETPVYYEKYEDGTYGIFGANLDTLAKNGKAVGDGYGMIFLAKPKNSVTVTYRAGSAGTETEVLLDPASAVKVDAKGETYWLLPLSKEIVNTEYAPEAFYQPIEVDGEAYYYNPYFAKTLTSDMPSTVANVVEVRTARQLYLMSCSYESYAQQSKQVKFTQGLDIDYKIYEWTAFSTQTKTVREQEPIGEGTSRAFLATYDGQEHTVSGISFLNTRRNSYFAGMFGDNQGVIRNLALVNEYQANNQDCYTGLENNLQGSRARAYIGVLAGRNSHIIRNCATAGYTLRVYGYRSSQAYIGGLTGYNSGTVRECSAETPKMEISATYADMYLGGFIGQNAGGLYNSYAIAAMEVLEAKEGKVITAGFAASNTGALTGDYCMSSVTNSGSAQSYGFAPVGGSVKNCFYLNQGTYFYIEKLHAYHLDGGDSRAQQVSGAELKTTRPSSRFAKAEASYYYGMTADDEQDGYPYPAVVTRNGKPVHYGNWIIEAQLGDVGMFYWEYEDGGANAGYHIRYIGNKDGEGKNGSSLCSAHDDGGIVREFGYGYYAKKGQQVTLNINNATKEKSVEGFANPGNINTAASEAIANQLSEYNIHAYTTETDEKKDSHLYLKENQPNGTWMLTYTQGTGTNAVHVQYQYTLNPFFANAFSYDGIITDDGLVPPDDADAAAYGNQVTAPGGEANSYKIRSAMQLQYINWNAYNHNTTSVVTANCTYDKNTYLPINPKEHAQNTYFPYLVYVSGKNTGTGNWNYYWDQTHDLDQQGKASDKGTYFTPIGSMFYTTGDDKGQAYIAYFGGRYDGNTYAIKNVEIHSDCEMTGLFGITAGARLENIVMYSEQDNTIEITDKSRRWYCLGGLVGFAAQGSGGNAENASIENCTVSGYRLLDSRETYGEWGGASIGGLAGASNMTILNCTAVNDITVALQYEKKQYSNIRVGGLVGNLRGTVKNAYCGGSIVSEVTTYNKFIASENGMQKAASIYTGGINGGIVMIGFGNLATLVGPTEGEAVVENSYTCVQLPKTGEHQVRSAQPIASIGEMLGYFTAINNPYIIVKNSYALDDTAKGTDDYETIKSDDEKKGWRSKYIFNKTISVNKQATQRWIALENEHCPYVTYDQLSDQGADGVKAWLNAKGGDFHFVTTTENGANIDGKYSYSGSERSLEGLNYPFPTVLTQKDTFGNTVYVHYGRWPKGDLYWAETMKSFDLLEALKENDSGFADLVMKLMTSATEGTETPVFTYMDEEGNVLEEASAVVRVVSADASGESAGASYDVLLRAAQEGTAIIRATLNGAQADLLLHITANLTLLAQPKDLELSAGEDAVIELSAKSQSDKYDFTPDVTWTVVMDDENIAECPQPAQYDEEAGAWKLNLHASKAGETSAVIQASYPVQIGAETKTFTAETTVLIHVAEASQE